MQYISWLSLSYRCRVTEIIAAFSMRASLFYTIWTRTSGAPTLFRVRHQFSRDLGILSNSSGRPKAGQSLPLQAQHPTTRTALLHSRVRRAHTSYVFATRCIPSDMFAEVDAAPTTYRRGGMMLKSLLRMCVGSMCRYGVSGFQPPLSMSRAL